MGCDNIYLKEGWSDNEGIRRWAVGLNSTLLLDFLKKSDYLMTLKVVPFIYENSPNQTISVFLNNKFIITLTLVKDWQKYEVIIPSSLILPKNNIMQFTYGFCKSPKSLGISEDARELSVMFDHIKFKKK